MLLSIPAGSTSKIIQVPIFDSSSTTGALLTGLVFNSTGLTAYYNREGAAGAATAITLVTATKGTWTSGGFIAVDGTNTPGWYEVHIPDAALATGAKSVILHLKGATNMVPVPILIELTATSNQDAVRGGMTALPASGTLAVNPVLASGTHTGAVIPTVSTLTGHTPQTGDSYARLGAPAGASVSADIANVPTVAEFNARTLVSASYFDPATDTVTVGTNNDKTGYVLTQSFPANFASMVISAGGAVDSLLQGYLNTLLTETSAGRIAGNIKVFWDNADALTTKVVDNVGAGSGGGTDWTTTEKENIRYRLGINGTQTAPTSNAPILPVRLDSQGKLDVNAEVDTALNTAIPGSPTANSINERIAAIDDLTQAGGSGDLAAILTDTGTTLNTHLTDIKGATFNGTTDSLEAIRNRGDAAWITATSVTATNMRGTDSALLASSYTAPDNTSIAAILVDTNELQTNQGNWLTATGFSTLTAADILTTALTESYATDGATFTLSQALYMIWATVNEYSAAGTTITAKKLDGATTAMTWTLDDGTNPTSRTRST